METEVKLISMIYASQHVLHLFFFIVLLHYKFQLHRNLSLLSQSNSPLSKQIITGSHATEQFLCMKPTVIYAAFSSG